MNDDDDYEFNNDDTITADRTKQKQRASFLHDSTYTLCPQDAFANYTEDDDHENEPMTNGLGVRSNSLGIVQLNRKSPLLDKPPKKVVRFADMLVGYADKHPIRVICLSLLFTENKNRDFPLNIIYYSFPGFGS